MLVLATTINDTSKAFGTKDEVDPVQRLIGAASAWGANPPRDATYSNLVPEKNEGQTVYRLHVVEVPVDGFWSVSVYNADGFYEPNDLNAYSLNNMTSQKNADGSVDIQFGGCDSMAKNCLPIVSGWNYMELCTDDEPRPGRIMEVPGAETGRLTQYFSERSTGAVLGGAVLCLLAFPGGPSGTAP